MTIARLPLVLNQSRLKDFQNCQRLYAWRYIENLVPPSRRSALEIGTAVHTGLAVFHGGGIPPSMIPPVDPNDDDSIAEHEEWTAASQLPLKDQAVFVALQKLRSTAGPTQMFEDKSLEEAVTIAGRVLDGYVSHWSDTGEVWKPLNQEVECLVEVGHGTQNFLRMRADNLSIWKGGLYLVDYKTAGRMDPRDLLKYEMDVQLSAYIYGLSKFLTEQARVEDPNADPIFIRGAIIDVLVKTIVPQYAREFYTRSEEELVEFEAEFNELANRLRLQLHRVAEGEPWKTVFPKNTDNCFRYGTCPYRDVCLKDTPVRRALYDHREPDYVDASQQEMSAYKEKSE